MVATPSKATFGQMSNAAGRGDNVALMNMLKGLQLGGGYAEYAGSPESNVTPERIGEWCLDTTNNLFYRAVGTANTDWTLVGSAATGNRSLQFNIFDDFHAAAIDATDNWIVFNGGGTSAASAATVTAPEGKVDMISGTAGTAGVADATVMSLILLAKGSLVSLGTTVMEARVSTSHINGATICVGLSDKLASGSAEAVLHVIKTAAIADDGLAVTNAISFVQDAEATGATLWHGVSENAGTIAHVAVAGDCALDVGPTANTYQVLKIEIDADGDARFYVDGVLKFTETTAVATTSLLIPYIAVTAEDGTPVSTTLSIDYVYFSGHRPSSNA
tara:strand:+ start:471 stop:1466 length:996 start_codon:yes stop_codon:yes gene_type:complete